MPFHQELIVSSLRVGLDQEHTPSPLERAMRFTDQARDVARTAALLLGLLLVLTGCMAGTEPSSSPAISRRPVPADSTQLSVFLQLKDPDGPSFHLGIASLEALSDGVWRSLSTDPFLIETESLGNSQLFLSRNVLPPGSYEGVRLKIAQAVMGGKGGTMPMDLSSDTVELRLSVPVYLKKGDSHSFFLTLDTVLSPQGSMKLSPVFSLASQEQLVVDGLIFAACPDINTVYTIRTDSNRVVGSVGIPGRPSFLGVDSTDRRLYVLSPGESMFYVIEIATGQIIDSIRIPLVSSPGYMTLSKDRRSAYVFDEQSGYVLRVGLTTGSIEAQVRLEEKPGYGTLLPDQNRLAVSSVRGNTVYLLDTVNLSTAETLAVGSGSAGMVASDNFLYIAETATNTLSLYDFTTRRTQRLNIGHGPGRMLAVGRQIFVANTRGGSLSVLLSGQLNATARIRTGNRPGEMVHVEDQRRLYVGDQGPGGLTVIDSTMNKKVGYVDLGAVPLGLAVVQ